MSVSWPWYGMQSRIGQCRCFLFVCLFDCFCFVFLKVKSFIFIFKIKTFTTLNVK